MSRPIPQLRDRPWLENARKTRTLAQIARELGCHKLTVWYATRRLGLSRQPPGPPLMIQDRAWLEEALRTLTVAEIAAAVPCTRYTVYRTIHLFGLAVPHPHRPHRTSPPELRDRAWLEDAYRTRSLQQIADGLGCSKSTVHGALNRHQIPFRPKGRVPRPR